MIISAVLLKQGFKRTIYWDKNRSEITKQPQNNNLDQMIDPTLRSINRFFILSFEKGAIHTARNSFSKY